MSDRANPLAVVRLRRRAPSQMLALLLCCAWVAGSAPRAPARGTSAHGTPAHGTSDHGTPARAAVSYLRIGSRGAPVRALQSELARLSYLPLSAVDGSFGTRTWNAVVAFQGWNGLQRDGIVGPHTRRALLSARPPRSWSTTTGLEIHIPQQVLLLVRAGRVARAIHVSTGMPGWGTPRGHFVIRARDPMSWSVQFHVWMPLAQYFYGGYALHEFSDVPSYPASHGCVRVPSAEAAVVWSFGRVGMRVWTAA